MIYKLIFDVFSLYFFGYYTFWNARKSFKKNTYILINKKVSIKDKIFIKAILFNFSYFLVFLFTMRSIYRVIVDIFEILKLGFSKM